jgi:tetratricopeptide (TPR) repeat protein
VVTALKVQLGVEEASALGKQATENVEAYRLYLQGRYHWAKYSLDGWTKALDCFNQAIAKDPSYALAYAGKADAYFWLATFGMPAREAFESGKAAAQRALELDDTLAEAHAAMGSMKAWYDWDWKGAETEFRRALELNPNLALAHDAYATFLQTQGRFDEALIHATRAVELDPLSSYMNVNLGWYFLESRQFDRAIEQSRKTLELDPNYVEAYRLMGCCFFLKRQAKEALELMLKVNAMDDRPYYAAGLAGAYVLSGKTNEALRILREWDVAPASRHVAPSSRAGVYMSLGDTNSALIWFKQACDSKDAFCPWFKVEPFLDGIRSHPEFQAMLKNMKFPER